MKRFGTLLAMMLLAMTVLTTAASAQEPATGRVTFLRAHEMGSGWGPRTDFIDVEVVVRLDTRPGEAFGFQLRNDARLPARQAMLDLLRDAFRDGHRVTLDYMRPAGRNNGILIRAALVK